MNVVISEIVPLGELAELVRRHGCDAGFAHDPDGDRLAIVDETGRVIDNDDVLALAVDAAACRERKERVWSLAM